MHLVFIQVPKPLETDAVLSRLQDFLFDSNATIWEVTENGPVQSTRSIIHQHVLVSDSWCNFIKKKKHTKKPRPTTKPKKLKTSHQKKPTVQKQVLHTSCHQNFFFKVHIVSIIFHIFIDMESDMYQNCFAQGHSTAQGQNQDYRFSGGF